MALENLKARVEQQLVEPKDRNSYLTASMLRKF